MIKGIIFNIKKFAIHDGPGIRTTIFFKGCSLDCAWCHNPESKAAQIEFVDIPQQKDNGSYDRPKKRQIGELVSVKYVMDEILKDELFYDESGGGVTISGGEPFLQLDFLTAILKECYRKGIHRVVDTSGYAPEDHFRQVTPLVDLYLFDVKMIDEQSHKAATGVSNRQILANLKYLAANEHAVEVRIPLIPGITDQDDNLKDIYQYIKSLPNIHNILLLPYNKLVEDKCKRFNYGDNWSTQEKQSPQRLTQILDLFRDANWQVRIET